MNEKPRSQPQGSKLIRVLVADDQEPVREAIYEVLAVEASMEVVGTAADADQAIELARQTRPDVVLLDVKMEGGGARAAAGIASASPSTKVVALSAYEDIGSVLEMLRNGAAGYLVKGMPAAEILEAIRRAVRSQTSL